MLKVDLSRSAAKFLRRLPPKHGRQVAAKITQLRDDPAPPDSSLLKGAADDLRRASASTASSTKSAVIRCAS